LALVIFLLFGIIFSQAAFNLTFLRPDTSEQTLVFAALSAIIFLLLVVLTFVLVRNLLKLYLERQAAKLGSKFRTKMVLGALVLSIGPVIAMFLFSYGLMNRSIDKWFSRPAEEVREHTSKVTSLLSNYAGSNAQAEVDAIVASPEAERAYRTGNFGAMLEEFRRRELTLQGGFAIALMDDHAEATFQSPDSWYVLKGKLPLQAVEKKSPVPINLDGKEYMLAASRVGTNGRVLIAMPLPAYYSTALRELEESERKYTALRLERKLIRQTYMQVLLLLTVVVLFAATWFALYLSKMVIRPVSALEQATQEISSGRLDYRVEVPAGDELAELVASFNRMASELESSRAQIEAGSRELEERRRYMETILESIPTGVVSLDASENITHVNTAFQRMFHLEGPDFARKEVLRERLGQEAANNGTVTCYVGGEERWLARARPVLAAFSARVLHLGPVGTGQIAKTINNMLLWACMAANFESLTLAKKLGADIPRLIEALGYGSGANWSLSRWGKSTGKWAEKDMDVALDLAQDAKVPMPIAGLVDQAMKAINQDKMKALLS